MQHEPTNIRIIPLPDNVRADRDVWIPMRDGVRLCANLFRPPTEDPLPVLIALTPYGKDDPPQRHSLELEKRWAGLGLSLGQICMSDHTPWEAPDPGYWAPHGYAVLHIDLRGFFKSEGHPAMFSRTEVQDYLDVIQWAGTQAWSNGRVGLAGVSYLAMAQWHAAAHNPPHLHAICPWEGASDTYRDILFHGGVPETMFLRMWGLQANRGMKGASASSSSGADAPEGPIHTPLIHELRLNRATLEDIRVPALICGSFSDQGLHTKGSFDGYQRIASTDKWLYTHGGGKWERFYGEDGLSWQRDFFERFLKGQDNAMSRRARVRLEVRRTRDSYSVRHEEEWPLENTRYQRAFLNAEDASLTFEPRDQVTVARYAVGENGHASFRLRFERGTELSGHMKLKLWVSTSEGDDMDLIVGVKKCDAEGTEVPFWGPEKHPDGVVTRGWLRVSHRELDPERSTSWQPVLTHAREQKLAPGEIVPVEIELLPSSTWFDAGESLELIVASRDLFSSPFHRHEQLCNQGEHAIHTGGAFDSHLLLPVIPPA